MSGKHMADGGDEQRITTENSTYWNGRADELIEDYLDRVCRTLIDSHPYHVRAELRQEIKQHLLSLASAYSEMGDEPVLAAQKALKKFGPAERVACQMKLLPAHRSRIAIAAAWMNRKWPAVACITAALFIGTACFSVANVKASRARAVFQRASAEANESRTLAMLPPLHAHLAVGAACTACHRSEVVGATAVYGASKPAIIRWRLPSLR